MLNSCRDATYKARQVLLGVITAEVYPNNFPDPEAGGLHSGGRNAIFDRIDPSIKPYLGIILSSLLLLILVMLRLLFKRRDQRVDGQGTEVDDRPVK